MRGPPRGHAGSGAFAGARYLVCRERGNIEHILREHLDQDAHQVAHGDHASWLAGIIN